MFEPQLTIPQWLTLPRDVQDRLKVLFEIPKSAGVETLNGRILSDGHTHADLKRISVAKMQEILKSEAVDFFELFNTLISKVEWDLAEEKLEAERKRKAAEVDPEKMAHMKALRTAMTLIEKAGEEIVEKKKRGRPSKTANAV